MQYLEVVDYIGNKKNSFFTYDF